MIMVKPMPNKNNPNNKNRYEQELEAGRQFADRTGMNWLAMKIQIWANGHRKAFLALVFGIVIGCFALNIIGMVRSYNASKKHRSTAVEQVDSALRQRHIINRR